MRLGRIIGLATLGYTAYKAYQSYSRTHPATPRMGGSSASRFGSLRRGGAT